MIIHMDDVRRTWSTADKEVNNLLANGGVCFLCGGGQILLTQTFDELDPIGVVVMLNGTEEERKKLISAAIQWQKGNKLHFLRYTTNTQQANNNRNLEQHFHLSLHALTVNISEKPNA